MVTFIWSLIVSLPRSTNIAFEFFNISSVIMKKGFILLYLHLGKFRSCSEVHKFSLDIKYIFGNSLFWFIVIWLGPIVDIIYRNSLAYSFEYTWSNGVLI